MAVNTGKGTRVGAVKDRAQFFNEKTEQWVKETLKQVKFYQVLPISTKV